MLFRTSFASGPWGMIQSTIAMGMWVTLRSKKRAARKTPGCRDKSRQVNKGYIGNEQHGCVKNYFWMLERHEFAHLDKCLQVSSDPLDTRANPNIYISPFQKKNANVIFSNTSSSKVNIESFGLNASSQNLVLNLSSRSSSSQTATWSLQKYSS
jgi:hypothetical protein